MKKTGRSKSSARSKSKSRSRSSPRKTLLKIGSASNLKLPTEDIRAQLMSFGDQIQQYLNKVNAKVEAFNFSVEKEGKGLLVDCQLKALVASPL